MRFSWDEYFLQIAQVVSTRSTCNRKQVGCVLVRDRTILSTGYGGSIRGQPHCIDEGCIIGPDGGCVTGGTVISKAQGGHYNTGHRTIKKIVEQWNHPHKKGAMMRMNVRSAMDNDILTSARVIHAWYSGVKETVTIITKLGRTVALTPDHLVRVPNGWKAAGDLVVGVDTVGLNGAPVYQSESWVRTQYEKSNATIASIARAVGCGETTIARMLTKFGIRRKTMSEIRWNTRRKTSPAGKEYTCPSHYRWAARHFALDEVCAVCDVTDTLQVHHIDGDYTNNKTSNLMTLCLSCHTIAKTPHAKIEAVRYDTVTAVLPAGRQKVFDLTVLPYHNFVGDGFVLHNCTRTVHAEINAVAQAARNGIRTDGATAYITLSPCLNCFKMMTNAGIVRIVFSEAYRIPIDPELVKSCGIEMMEYSLLK